MQVLGSGDGSERGAARIRVGWERCKGIEGIADVCMRAVCCVHVGPFHRTWTRPCLEHSATSTRSLHSKTRCRECECCTALRQAYDKQPDMSAVAKVKLEYGRFRVECYRSLPIDTQLLHSWVGLPVLKAYERKPVSSLTSHFLPTFLRYLGTTNLQPQQSPTTPSPTYTFTLQPRPRIPTSNASFIHPPNLIPKHFPLPFSLLLSPIRCPSHPIPSQSARIRSPH